MYCCNCGKEIPEGSSFCPGCGASVQELERNTSSEVEVKNKINTAIFRQLGLLALATGVFWLCWILFDFIVSDRLLPLGVDYIENLSYEALEALSTIKPVLFTLVAVLSILAFLVSCLILALAKKRTWGFCVLSWFIIGCAGAACIFTFGRLILVRMSVFAALMEDGATQLRGGSIMCGISIPTVLGSLYLCTKQKVWRKLFRNMAIIAGLFTVVSILIVIIAVYALKMWLSIAFLLVVPGELVCFVISLILNKEKQQSVVPN